MVGVNTIQKLALIVGLAVGLIDSTRATEWNVASAGAKGDGPRAKIVDFKLRHPEVRRRLS